MDTDQSYTPRQPIDTQPTDLYPIDVSELAEARGADAAKQCDTDHDPNAPTL